MYSRFGRGRGMGRGAGFGFRGCVPAYPYIGRGRGGLPRCGYFVPQELAPEAKPDDLNVKARLIREQLAQIESRVEELKKADNV